MRLPRGEVALAQAPSSARWRCSTGCHAAPRSSPPNPLPFVLYASDFYGIAAHIPSLVEAVEREARRRRAENQGSAQG